MRRDHLDALGDLEPGQARVDDEGRDAARSRRFTRACEQHVEVRDAAVADPGLLAVQHIGIAVITRAARQRGDIRPGLGFGQRKCRDRRTARDLRQVARALGRGAVQRDRPRAQALHREREVRETMVVRERLAQQADRPRVDDLGRAAVCAAGDGMAQPVGLAELAHERAALRVDVVAAVAVREVLQRPIVQRRREFAVVRVEERPGQMSVRHAHRQSPSNTGFCLPTNAS